MKKEKVRVQLEVWGQAVMFRVLYMDERFRSKKEAPYNPSYVCDNKITITSVRSPELDEGAVYLWGYYHDQDTDGQCWAFDTAEDAKAYKMKILDALADWAENWPGWAEDEEQAEVDSPPGEIYSF